MGEGREGEMSIELKRITLREEYLDIEFEGEYEGISDARSRYSEQQAQVLAACQENECYKILWDNEDIRYENNAVIEHFLGVSIANLREPRFKWAVLVSRTSESQGAILERVATSRGVALSVFRDRDEAVNWLLGD